MMAQNAVARATAPAGGAGIGCWSFQTPGPVSSGSSGAKADGGLPSRSGIATGTGPIGRRTPVAAGRVQPLTPVELRPLPSAPALQIPELLPSPVLQSASSADAPRPAARPPLPLLVCFRPLREAQLAPAQPRRFPALRVEPVHDHVTCGCPPRCATISAWCFCSPSAFRLSVACPGSTLPLRRLILAPVTATWTPYGRHNEYPRLTLSST